ncbi:MAG: phage terminase large subunit, partial [Dehalococcoidia bacterium]
EIGSRHFDLHYMGLITAREGTIFKPHWWSYWDATAAPGAGADALGVFPAQAGIQGGPSTHPHSPQPEPPPTPAALARAERRAAREAAQRESEGQRLQQEHDAVAATPAEGHGEHADAVANAGEPTDADSSFDRLRTNGDSAQEQDGAAPPAEGHGEHADAVASAGEPTDAGPSFDRLRTNGDSAAPPGASLPPLTTENRQLTTLPTPTWVVLSVDTASKTGLTNDYSAATVWALCQLDWKRLPSAHSGPRSTHYLLHAWRDRLEYPDLLRTVEGMARQWRAQHIIIEDKGAGQALIPELRRRGLNAIPNNPTADKVTRAIGVTAVPEAGRVFLPRHAGWLEDFRYELETFPRARHDDWTDTVVQYLEWAAVHGDAFHGIWIL